MEGVCFYLLEDLSRIRIRNNWTNFVSNSAKIVNTITAHRFNTILRMVQGGSDALGRLDQDVMVVRPELRYCSFRGCSGVFGTPLSEDISVRNALLASALITLISVPALAQYGGGNQNAGGGLASEARGAGVRHAPRAHARKTVKRVRSGQSAGGPAGGSISTTGGGPAVMRAAPTRKKSGQSSGG